MSAKQSVGKVYSHEELMEMSKRDLNEDPKRTKADIKAIKEWIKKQPHLAKTAKQDDAFILFMLRGCKFSLEKTKKKIESWNTIRGMCPELFEGWDTEEPKNKALIDIGVQVVLPGYDKHGRKVIVQRLNQPDPKYSPDEICKITSMIADLYMLEYDLQTEVCGIVVISENAGVTLSHVTNYTPSWMKKVTIIFEDMYPSRPKVMHFLNMPGFIMSLFNLFKGLMKKKIQERMIIHAKGDTSALVDDLGPDVLPAEYGGTNGTMEEHVASMAKLLHANRDWLMQQTKHKANEKKRQGIVKSYSDIFGMEGSFRQLDFD